MVRPVWAEVDLSAIKHNLREVRRLVGDNCEIMGVVKADAYGHGAYEVSRALLEAGVNRLAVAILDEAVKLREAGISRPILVLGYTPPEDFSQLVEHDVIQTIFDQDSACQLSRTAQAMGKKAVIHIKVDTGMGRIGFFPEGDRVAVIREISLLPGIEIEGIFTHFATADEQDKTFARRQLGIFLDFCRQLEKAGVELRYRHAANSAAIIDLPEAHLDLVRPGIMLYGLYPSAEVNRVNAALRPVMSLKTRIAYIKKVSSGTTISYGRTYTTPDERVIATLPIGYADGYNRLLSNRGEVLVNGRRAKLVGRVCMDQCMVDITHLPEARVGDEVVLFGRQGETEIPVEEIASLLGTINYEVVCMVGKRVPRVYV